MKRAKKKLFSATMASIIFSTRSLNEIILYNSDRPKRIVQINNVLHVIYSVIGIQIVDVKVCDLPQGIYIKALWYDSFWIYYSRFVSKNLSHFYNY